MKQFSIILLVLLCIFLSSGCQSAPGAGDAEQYQARAYQLELENADLRKQLDAARENASEDASLDPLIEALQTHPELIPIEGQLGGQMIYYPNECKVLNSRYLYAYAEDGHVAADMLVHYYENEDGSYAFSLALYDIGGGWQTAEN